MIRNRRLVPVFVYRLCQPTPARYPRAGEGSLLAMGLPTITTKMLGLCTPYLATCGRSRFRGSRIWLGLAIICNQCLVTVFVHRLFQPTPHGIVVQGKATSLQIVGNLFGGSVAAGLRVIFVSGNGHT